MRIILTKDAPVTHRPETAETPDALVRAAYGDARVTAPRAAIAAVAVRMPGAFTVDDLSAAVRAVYPRHASTATVYRAVAAMAAAGFVERVGTRAGSALYARCHAGDHHHHIVCDGCGETVEADCPLGPDVATGAAASGFTITRHEVTLYGLCPSCSRTGPVT